MRNKQLVLLSAVFLFKISLITSQDLKRGQWKSYYQSGLIYLEMDSIEQAYKPITKSFEIASKHFRKKEKYGKSLLAYYEVNIKNGSVSTIDSLDLTKEILNVSKSLKLSKRIKFSQNIQKLAELNLNSKRINKAISLYNERIRVLKEEADSLSLDYAVALYGLGKSYKASLKNKLKGEEILEEVLLLIKRLDLNNEIGEEKVLIDLVGVYLSLNKKQKADKAAESILDKIQATEGIKSQSYANKLNLLGQIYLNYDILNEAYRYESLAIQIFEDMGDLESNGYLLANYLLGRIEKGNNNYEESIKAYKKVQKIFIDKDFQELDNYAIILGNIGLCYDRVGDYEKALEYCNEALKVKGIWPNTKSIRLMDKAYFYENMGQFEKSHSIYEEALAAMEISHGKEHPEYAKLLNNIGKLYVKEGNYEEANSYFDLALKIVEVEKGQKWHPFYSYMLNDYANSLFQLGQKNQAIDLMEQNIAYFENNNLPKAEDYYNRKHSLAKIYNLTKQFNQAKPLIDEATKNIKLILGEDHVDFGQFLKTKSETYFGLKDFENAVTFLKASNIVYINQVDKIFQFSSEVEKKAFLKMISKNINAMQSLGFSEKVKNKELNALNLNNQLILKSLLLNNSRNVFSGLKQLKIDAIDKKILAYKTNKIKLANVLTESTSQRTINVDSLRQHINSSEAELVRIYSDNFKYSQSLVKDWKDIKSHLKSDEVAIEYSNFNYVDNGKPTNNIQYVAYIFNSTDTYPKAIPLCNQRELNAAINRKTEDEIYNSEDLYAMIWKPLESELKNIKTVYYSPSGLLNQISLAALKNNNKPLILGKQLIQMSSTHKLITSENHFNIDSSLLVGGVRYDYTENGVNENEAHLQNTEVDIYSYALSKSRGTKSRGESWTFLEGTISEIENISDILSASGTSVSVLIKDNASEKEFKNIDGQSPTLIHIATHGYFYENRNVDITKQSNLSTEDQYRLSEDPLLRSGLILAGANYTWRTGQKHKNQEEDGILTALEISNLDLSNTELVILSACKTGLGDIDGSEGVYGLQRAFKMAGVDKLIMSLWEVPDVETSEFMVIFYKNWMNIQSINKAFIKTQRQMAKKYKNQPSKWAAFVLIE